MISPLLHSLRESRPHTCRDVNPQQLGEHEYFAERLKNTTIPAIQSLLKAARPKIPKVCLTC